MYGTEWLNQFGDSQTKRTWRVSSPLAKFFVEDLYQSCNMIVFSSYTLDSWKLKASKRELLVLLKETVDWAVDREKGGYTKVFSSIRANQNVRKILEQAGFKQIGEPHINKRTRHKIIWLQGDLKEMQTKLKELVK